MTGTTIYFVRHGAHDQLGRRLCGRAPGVLIGETGLAQAGAAARRLAGAGVAAVHTSPLERTRQTAEPIAAAAGAPLVLDDDLTEIDFGDWNGADFADLDDRPEWRRWNEDRGRARPPGGESMTQVQARLAGWFDRIQNDPRPAVVAVSHADVIKAAVSHVLGLPIHFHDRFEIGPGSITTVIADDRRLKLHSLNETPHD